MGGRQLALRADAQGSWLGQREGTENDWSSGGSYILEAVRASRDSVWVYICECRSFANVERDHFPN